MSNWFIFLLSLNACTPKGTGPTVGANAMQSPPLAEQQPHTHRGASAVNYICLTKVYCGRLKLDNVDRIS